ncbi:MAG: Kazal-type serine protease inhibitor family protein [Candidatus Woesearchaeota archaeon]
MIRYIGIFLLAAFLVGCATQEDVQNDVIEEPTDVNGEVFCSTDWDPVCGVDGQTYSNECVAVEQNNVDVAYYGECQGMAEISIHSPLDVQVDGVVYMQSETEIVVVNYGDQQVQLEIEGLDINDQIDSGEVMSYVVTPEQSSYTVFVDNVAVSEIIVQ